MELWILAGIFVWKKIHVQDINISPMNTNCWRMALSIVDWRHLFTIFNWLKSTPLTIWIRKKNWIIVSRAIIFAGLQSKAKLSRFSLAYSTFIFRKQFLNSFCHVLFFHSFFVIRSVCHVTRYNQMPRLVRFLIYVSI